MLVISDIAFLKYAILEGSILGPLLFLRNLDAHAGQYNRLCYYKYDFNDFNIFNLQCNATLDWQYPKECLGTTKSASNVLVTTECITFSRKIENNLQVALSYFVCYFGLLEGIPRVKLLLQ